MTTPKTIQIDSLTIDPRLQTRAGGNNPEWVTTLADAYQRGDVLPPVRCVEDCDHLWLAGGFQRVEALQSIGATEVDAVITKGTFDDALLISLQDNAKHGLTRTDDDKRRAVEIMLSHGEWKDWSTNSIAERLNLSWSFVDKIRTELGPKPTEVKFEREGKPGTMDTAKIGKNSQAAPPPAEPTSRVRSGAATPADTTGGEDGREGADLPPSSCDQTSGATSHAGSAKPNVAAGAPAAVKTGRPIIKDASGHPVPRALVDVFEDDLHRDAPAKLDWLMQQFKQASRWSQFLRLADLLEHLSNAKQCVIDAQPHVVHRECKGAGCEKCRNTGFLTKWAAEEIKLTEKAA